MKANSLIEKLFSKFSLAKPKEVAKLVAPLLVMVVMMILDGATADVYPEDYVETAYPLFIRGSIIVYLVCAVISIWFEYFRRHFCKWWGLIIFFYAASGIYNLCTVKSGILTLPYMPSFDSMLAYLFNHFGRCMGDLCNSVTLYLQGILIGGVLGFLWGSAMGYSKHANYWLNPIIKIIGPVPGVAWVTVSMTLGASNWYIIRHVVYPAAAPSIFTGLFMACCFSLTSLVTAETMGVEGGLGWRMGWAQSYVSYDIIYMIAIIFILMAFVLITILFIVQRHCMSWSKEVVQW